MAVTLLEASKNHKGDVVRSAVIEMFARSSPLMGAMPFMDISGNAYHYNQEGALPGVAFRAVNEAFGESTGILNPQTEVLRIVGGDLDVDRALLKFNGEEIRAQQEAAKVKALGGYITKKIIKGDSVAEPREFDGLMNRINGQQLVEAGSTDGGDPLSLLKLDTVIDEVEGANYILASKAIRRLLTAAGRTTSVSGYITHSKNEFGEEVTMYNHLPLLIVDTDDTGARILDFNEVGTGGSTATATSLYVVALGDGMLTGLQNGDMDVRDLGEMTDKPVMRTRVDWYVGLAALHGRCAARLRGISNAAVVA